MFTLTWAHQIRTIKLKQDFRLCIIKYFLNTNTNLLLHTKLNLYKTLRKPFWIYDIRIWKSAKKSNIINIKIIQNKTFRLVTKAPFYILNQIIYNFLKIRTVLQTAFMFFTSYCNSILDYPNILTKSFQTNAWKSSQNTEKEMVLRPSP